MSELDLDALEDEYLATFGEPDRRLFLVFRELRASRKVVAAAELLEGTGPRPILLNALEEWEELK